MAGYRIQEDCILFSIEIIKLYKSLVDKEKEYILSKQILRSGTSIGANIRESQFASSDKDFIHKLRIALKEANETEYRLYIITKSELINDTYGIKDLRKRTKRWIGTLVNIINSKIKRMK